MSFSGLHSFTQSLSVCLSHSPLLDRTGKAQLNNHSGWTRVHACVPVDLSHGLSYVLPLLHFVSAHTIHHFVHISFFFIERVYI